MGVSYDIIDLETNQIVNTFGLKWLQQYTDFNIPKFDRYDMLDYCQEEIDKLTEQLSEYEKKQSVVTLTDLKNGLISKIYPCEDEDDLKEILQTFLDERALPPDEDAVMNIRWLIQHFKSFQDFLIPYIWSSYNKYKTEISY